MNRTLITLAVLSLTLAACGTDNTAPPATTIIVNEPTGLQCVADAFCPWGMQCNTEKKLCEVKPPDPDKFWVSGNAPYEHTKSDSGIVMLFANRNCNYSITIFEKNKIEEGTLRADITTPLRITGLSPDTSYLLLISATSTDGEHMETYASIVTKAALPNPNLNAQIVIDYSTVTIDGAFFKIMTSRPADIVDLKLLGSGGQGWGFSQVQGFQGDTVKLYSITGLYAGTFCHIYTKVRDRETGEEYEATGSFRTLM